MRPTIENFTRLIPVIDLPEVFIAQNTHFVQSVYNGANYTVIEKSKIVKVDTIFGPVEKTVKKVVPGKFDSLVDAQNALSR